MLQHILVTFSFHMSDNRIVLTGSRMKMQNKWPLGRWQIMWRDKVRQETQNRMGK